MVNRHNEMRSAIVDTEEIEHGSVLEFSRPTPSISAGDILILHSRSGTQLHLSPDGERDDGGVYAIFSPEPAMYLTGWLDRVDDLHWRFQLEPHHLGVLAIHRRQRG